MKKLWLYVSGAFVFLIGLLIHERTKRKSAEALNEAHDMNLEVENIEGDIIKINVLLGIEEIDRKKQKEVLDKKTNEKLNDNDLADFFKRRE